MGLPKATQETTENGIGRVYPKSFEPRMEIQGQRKKIKIRPRMSQSSCPILHVRASSGRKKETVLLFDSSPCRETSFNLWVRMGWCGLKAGSR